MPKVNLRNYGRNDYDGGTKLYTKNCPGCRFNLPPPIKDSEACYWGEAWKYLIKTDKPRKCTLPLNKSPREKSMLESETIKAKREQSSKSQDLSEPSEIYQKPF
ncbi:MAG: hypothetical protein PHU12_03885 [Candidatus Aenigmarchaeota archaeon]|nr:hypothetical protein [Candidatus Aenigmarchaeota archaeon]